MRLPTTATPMPTTAMSSQRKRFFNTRKPNCDVNALPTSHDAECPRPRHSLQSRLSFNDGNTSNSQNFSLPERSLSGSAALLRQRAGYLISSSSTSSSPPTSEKKMIWPISNSGADETLLPQYTSYLPMSASSPPSHFSESDGSSPSSANYHLNIHHHYSNTHGLSRRRSRARWNYCLKSAFSTMILLSLSLRAINTHHNNWLLESSIQMRELDILQHQENIHQLEHRIDNLRSETDNLQSQVKELEGAPNLTQLEMQRKLFHLERHKTQVEQAIQADSRRQIIERFGPGPHYYVEITVQFDPESRAYDQDHNAVETMLVETAHLDDMPHSVHLFLEQVDHGLFDASDFHRNADHILQAGPSGIDDASENQRERYTKFVKEYPSLLHTLFQEYSADFPHREYTLGYSGRPSGPDFYINLSSENEQLHGPGGQTHHYATVKHGDPNAVPYEDADPCFARIIRGTDVVDRMRQSQIKPGISGNGMLHPVAIKSMHIVPGPADSLHQ